MNIDLILQSKFNCLIIMAKQKYCNIRVFTCISTSVQKTLFGSIITETITLFTNAVNEEFSVK